MYRIYRKMTINGLFSIVSLHFFFWIQYFLGSSFNPSLAEHDMPWICTVCHQVCEFIATIQIKHSDWLKIRSGRGIFIYRMRRVKLSRILNHLIMDHLIKRFKCTILIIIIVTVISIYCTVPYGDIHYIFDFTFWRLF